MPYYLYFDFSGSRRSCLHHTRHCCKNAGCDFTKLISTLMQTDHTIPFKLQQLILLISSFSTMYFNSWLYVYRMNMMIHKFDCTCTPFYIHVMCENIESTARTTYMRLLYYSNHFRSLHIFAFPMHSVLYAQFHHGCAISTSNSVRL